MGTVQAGITDICVCIRLSDVIIKGSATVIVGGMPPVRICEITGHDRVIVIGRPAVMISDQDEGGEGEAPPVIASGPAMPEPAARTKALQEVAEKASRMPSRDNREKISTRAAFPSCGSSLQSAARFPILT